MRSSVVRFPFPDAPALPPELSERYEIIECLSSRLQSETFLVRSRQSGGTLLAKTSNKTDGGEDERTILERLDHPAIPKAAEAFETAETVCVIREFIEGTPLDGLDLPLEESRALDIGVQLCDILTYLHSRSPPVIHRDIKPQNVILDNGGKIHLIDFGISRRYSDDALKDTALIGTEGFMPPEQYGFKQTDCRADIFSLGILLCFLLTGGRDIDAMDGSASKELTRVILKCAEFSPKDRYPTAEAVKKVLLESKAKRVVRWVGMAAAVFIPLAVAAVLIIGQLQAETPSVIDPPADEVVTFVRGIGNHTVFLDFLFDKTYDLSGFEYLLADVKFSGEDSLRKLGQLWLVVGHDDYRNNLYLTAFGYGADERHTSAGEEITGRAEGEWFTVWFPVHHSYAQGSNPEGCDLTSINMLRYEIVYGDESKPDQASTIPLDAAFSIANIRASNSKDGTDAMPLPIVGDGVRYGERYGELVGG
jgi:hypothetical protein